MAHQNAPQALGPDRPENKHRDGARRFAIEAAQVLRDDKCDDVLVLDVRGQSPVTDYVVIASGTSDRQMVSAMDDAVKHGSAVGMPAFRTSRDERATWLVADFVDVMVHVFEPNARALYDLEMLWGDAERVTLPDGPGPLAQQRENRA